MELVNYMILMLRYERQKDQRSVHIGHNTTC